MTSIKRSADLCLSGALPCRSIFFSGMSFSVKIERLHPKSRICRRTRQLSPKATDEVTSNIHPSAQEPNVPFASYFLKPFYSDTSHQREDQQYHENQAQAPAWALAPAATVWPTC